MHSINVLVIVCDGSTQANIYGQATINGSAKSRLPTINFIRANTTAVVEPTA
jgi:hypothetical protein